MIDILDIYYGIENVDGHKDFALNDTVCPGNVGYQVLIEEGIITSNKV